ncbi:hypothetical protein VPHG_00037 [Vibrio phage 11895-B1]|nr:hypothetical protein VPHG_00037 [Vibrio phage 11895-B1]AGH32104.1 hypothetical protein VPHG_00037 [Vibrio phage 11895-B1]
MKLNNTQKRRIQRAVRLAAWDTSKRISDKKITSESDTGTNRQRVVIVRG